jgi:putative SOS response-associated peptidase YedK
VWAGKRLERGDDDELVSQGNCLQDGNDRCARLRGARRGAGRGLGGDHLGQRIEGLSDLSPSDHADSFLITHSKIKGNPPGAGPKQSVFTNNPEKLPILFRAPRKKSTSRRRGSASRLAQFGGASRVKKRPRAGPLSWPRLHRGSAPTQAGPGRSACFVCSVVVCGRYTNTAGVEELNDRFNVPIADSAGTHRFNIAPTEEVLAIVSPKGEPQSRLLRWGLVPSWAHEIPRSRAMINARMETVASTPAYRRLIPRGARRALQLADGYFEWLKPERRGAPRQPFHFQVDGGIPFAFAAVWTPAKIEDEWIASVALLTCDSSANPVAAAIHKRMPVILADRNAQLAWLDHSLGAEEALELCGALPASRLSARPANPAVNKVDGAPEGPELLRAPEAPSGEVHGASSAAAPAQGQLAL